MGVGLLSRPRDGHHHLGRLQDVPAGIAATTDAGSAPDHRRVDIWQESGDQSVEDAVLKQSARAALRLCLQ